MKAHLVPTLTLVAVLLPACASAPRPSTRARVVPTTAEATEDDWNVAAPPPPSRPRLTHTITLGEAWAASPSAAHAGSTTLGAPTVVIQNQVSVVNQAPTYVGGYGYGGIPGTGGVRAPVSSSSSSGGSWGTTGWEGASGRPAPAGQTPGVAGNWAPPPSYGPR